MATQIPLMDDSTYARLFAAQYAEFDDDLPLWRRLASEANGPILEVGCGHGRVLCALAREGVDLVGIDTNRAMLVRARLRLTEEERQRVPLIEQDVRQLHLPDRFALVLAPCNTLAGLTDTDLLQALTRVRLHLQPGGILAFEAPGLAQANEITLADEPLATFLEPESGHPVQVYATQRVEEGGRCVLVDWRYDELLPDGSVKPWSLPSTFHLRTPEEYARLLAKAGFRESAVYGGYHLEPLAPDSLTYIILGRT